MPCIPQIKDRKPRIALKRPLCGRPFARALASDRHIAFQKPVYLSKAKIPFPSYRTFNKAACLWSIHHSGNAMYQIICMTGRINCYKDGVTNDHTTERWLEATDTAKTRMTEGPHRAYTTYDPPSKTRYRSRSRYCRVR